jgi:hypothetical protein
MVESAELHGTARRILALDGGGVRGIVSIAFLEQIEAQLRQHSGRSSAVLADHFHLIGGTSVGSIIATMLALGWPMAEVSKTFRSWCPQIFGRAIAFGILRSKFDADVLEDKLETTLGDMRLDDPRLRTLLAIVTKRLDTGSPWWIVTNNPASRWWDGPGPERRNRAYKLADLVRASTAAPTVFEPKRLPIGRGLPYGTFVDGAISPFNSPALAMLMMARLEGHGLNWQMGADRLKIVSVGTGIWREPVHYGFWHRRIVALFGSRALQGMITDTQMLNLALLQWMSRPRMAHRINAEIGDLGGDLLVHDQALFGFQRYDLEITSEEVSRLSGADRRPSTRRLARLRSLDDPSSLDDLYQLSQKAAREQVHAGDFI